MKRIFLVFALALLSPIVANAVDLPNLLCRGTGVDMGYDVELRTYEQSFPRGKIRGLMLRKFIKPAGKRELLFDSCRDLGTLGYRNRMTVEGALPDLTVEATWAPGGTAGAWTYETIQLKVIRGKGTLVQAGGAIVDARSQSYQGLSQVTCEIEKEPALHCQWPD